MNRTTEKVRIPMVEGTMTRHHRTPSSRFRELAASTLMRHLAGAALAMLVVVALTLVTDPFTNLRFAMVGFYLIAVAGLALLTGLSGQISLGHGAFMFVGAYTVALLVLHQPALPLWFDLMAASVAGGMAGLLAGAAAARLHGPYLAGATLALAVGLPAVTQRYPEVLGGSNGLSFTTPGPPAALGDGFATTRWQAWVVWFTVLLALVVLANLTRSRIGRNLRAVRDDEVAAALAGIHVGRTKVLAFVLSSACAGLAGGLLAYVLGTAAPSSFGLVLSLSLLAAVVLGGMGSLWGALWGALALVYMGVWADATSESLHLSADLANNLPIAIYGVILIAVILGFPQGIHGGLRRLHTQIRMRFS
jgi:branched-chain amino acid transport system permease protein